MDFNSKPVCVTNVTKNMQIYLPKQIRELVSLQPGIYQTELRDNKIVFLTKPPKYYGINEQREEVRLRMTWQFVLPRTFKFLLGVEGGDSLNIFFNEENDEIILVPITNRCCICSSNEQEQLCSFMNKHICRNCIKSIIDIFSD